jgi:hypothetical protein
VILTIDPLFSKVGLALTLVRRRFGSALRIASACASRQVGKTVLKFEVCHDDIVKKPSKTPATTLMFNDLM